MSKVKCRQCLSVFSSSARARDPRSHSNPVFFFFGTSLDHSRGACRVYPVFISGQSQHSAARGIKATAAPNFMSFFSTLSFPLLSPQAREYLSHLYVRS